jgi:hypothetical protein
MKLSNSAIEAIKGNPRIMNLIAAEMECTESTVRRWINNNDDELTKAVPLQIIREETGLTDDEILTRESAA